MKIPAPHLLPVVLGFLAPLACPPGSAAPAPRPNVLFIAVDDLRVNLGCYGDSAAITPHLDRLAARGTVFVRAYCQQAVCNPSRQSLLSGRRPDSIRVWDLNRLFRQTAPDVVPLPEHFKLHGYFTQSFGKIYHGTAGMNDPQSWSVPEQFEAVAKRDDYQLPENRQPTAGQKAAAVEFAAAPDDAYPDSQVAAAAVAAINGFADAQIGRVLDALERTGLAPSTLVVFWGDNGFHLGEHGLWTKTTNYEADTRVPLIVATPDARRRGVRTSALVELLDIYPTLIELCGLPAREKLEGRSFAANLGNPAAAGRAAALSQFPRPWVSGRNFRPEFMGYTARTATHRYVEWRRLADAAVVARELYAYQGDELFETENLADRPGEAGRRRALAALLPPPAH